MSDLHLLKCVLDVRVLLSFARAQGLLHREVDDGYVVHAAFSALFGERAPGPFVIEAALDPGLPEGEGGGPIQVVLAYADAPIASLRALAGGSDPAVVRWDRSESKPMPRLEAGREVGFISRVMPTVRSRASRPDHPESGRGHGREVDAFLAACSRAPREVVDRTTVYRDWMARELSAPREAAASPSEMTDFSLRRFQRVRVIRKEQARDGGRKRRSLERPDAVISGALRVADAEAFRELLRRGVGRHRAFGFGMLLLRRV